MDDIKLDSRRFAMYRTHDQTGVSGNGKVLEGIIFNNLKCVIHWRTPSPNGSIAIFDSIHDFIKIHVSPHPDNKTKLFWENGDVIEFKKTI